MSSNSSIGLGERSAAIIDVVILLVCEEWCKTTPSRERDGAAAGGGRIDMEARGWQSTTDGQTSMATFVQLCTLYSTWAAEASYGNGDRTVTVVLRVCGVRRTGEI